MKLKALTKKLLIHAPSVILEILIAIFLLFTLIKSCSGQVIYNLSINSKNGILLYSSHIPIDKFKSIPEGLKNKIAEANELCRESISPESARNSLLIYEKIAKINKYRESLIENNAEKYKKDDENFLKKISYINKIPYEYISRILGFSNYYMGDAILTIFPIKSFNAQSVDELVEADIKVGKECSLESYESSLMAGLNLTPKESRSYLKYVKKIYMDNDFRESFVSHVDISSNLWFNQDIKNLCRIESIYNKNNDIDSVFYKTIIGRNKALSSSIFENLKMKDGVIFLVGAHHYCGEEESMNNILKSLGVKVEAAKVIFN